MRNEEFFWARLNFVHDVENILVLSFYFDADWFTLLAQFLLQVNEPDFALARFGKEDHIKKAVQNILVDAENVYVIVRKNFRHAGDYPHAIFADHCHDQFQGYHPSEKIFGVEHKLERIITKNLSATNIFSRPKTFYRQWLSPFWEIKKFFESVDRVILPVIVYAQLNQRPMLVLGSV